MKSEKGFARFSNCSAAPIFPTIYTCICLFFPPAFHFVLVVVVVVFLLSLFFFSLLAVYGTAKRPFISYYFGSICSFCGNYRERDWNEARRKVSVICVRCAVMCDMWKTARRGCDTSNIEIQLSNFLFTRYVKIHSKYENVFQIFAGNASK